MAVETKAVMLAHARSGSTLLMEFLDRQQGVTFAHEIFHQDKVHLPAFMPGGGLAPAALKATRDADPVGFLDAVVAACPTPVFGFKWFRGHDPAIRDRLVADPTWRVVVLYRENFLALFASQRTARLTGRYIERGAAPTELPVLPFDPEAFLHEYGLYRRYYEGVLAQCHQAGKAFHLIEYQHLSHPVLMCNAARHVGVAHPVPVPPRMVKQGTTRLLSRFEDAALVRRTLERINRLHWLVEEDGFFAAPSGGMAA